MARYTITIEDHKKEKKHVIETEGYLLSHLHEKGVGGVTACHNPIDSAMLLISVNELCMDMFNRHPELRDTVDVVRQHTGKKISFDF